MIITPREGKVCLVFLTSAVVLKPQTVTRVTGRLEKKIEQYIVEPVLGVLVHALIPRTIHQGGAEPVVCLINASDRHIKFFHGQKVGVVSEAEVIVPEYETTMTWCRMDKSPYQCRVKGIGDPVEEMGVPVVPPRLTDLFERSKVHLEDDDRRQLAELLIEFHDVFARDELDLGDFSAREHSIDTGDAKRLRRTALGFAEEEEEHLKKMLKGGIIQPSSSEWASAPVLIRKKCGGVRWCIDFRSLNARTRKTSSLCP
ncbi:uncharacterized protein LOC125381600 [Haliotis rufescens]|uniref:uncharacterized protein LOC125381600 n=1 Tax=Haliotis rufescens TaxID=6454 RepID=UPI00201FA903|nr:uncharacterized protein LOC125381600 [Haliotis rufescens]